MSGENRPQTSPARRIFWFVALWLAGVAGIGAIGYVIKFALSG